MDVLDKTNVVKKKIAGHNLNTVYFSMGVILLTISPGSPMRPASPGSPWLPYIEGRAEFGRSPNTATRGGSVCIRGEARTNEEEDGKSGEGGRALYGARRERVV